MSVSRKHLTIIAAIPVVLAFISSLLYAAQGGFGAGHGRFDQAIVILGFPWVLIPFPVHHHWPDFFNLILVPLLLNSMLVSGVAVWLRMAKT